MTDGAPRAPRTGVFPEHVARFATLLLLVPVGLARVGCGTRPGRTSSRPAAPAAPESSWVDPSPHRVRRVTVAPGVTLEVLDWGGPARSGRASGGESPPLVFLAGFGNTAHVFDGFAPQFRDRHHVVAITRRGFGASTLATTGYDNATLVRDVLAVVDSLRLERPTFVAHSFGGAELNGIGVRHPHAARALVYLDGGFDFAELYADSAWMRVPIPRPPQPPGGVRSVAEAVAYGRLMTGPDYPEAEVRAQNVWGARLASAPAFHADSLQAWLVRGTPPAALGAIRAPALAVYGVPRTVEEKYPWAVGAPPALRRAAERRFAVEAPLLAHQRARFGREVPGARMVRIAGGRHYVFLTHPREVARAIRAFADGPA